MTARRVGTWHIIGSEPSKYSAKTKFDLERSLHVGQINHAQNANLKIAFLYGGLFFVIGSWLGR